MNVLCVGDVVAEPGLRVVERLLGGLKKFYAIDFTVVNGENARGQGISSADAERLYLAGADVITLGNHALGCREIFGRLDDDPYLLRPANFTDRAPGKGFSVYDASKGRRVAVMSLMGRAFMDSNLDNPFFKADALIKACDTPFIIVDFHADATSEKGAFARYVDGRVSAVFGTHTHVPTADARVLPNGTGFITDVGMCGAVESVIGHKPEASIARFVGEPFGGDRQAKGDASLMAVRFELDDRSGKCVAVERIEAK